MPSGRRCDGYETQQCNGQPHHESRLVDVFDVPHLLRLVLSLWVLPGKCHGSSHFKTLDYFAEWLDYHFENRHDKNDNDTHATYYHAP
jgi:hypothetical protein